MSPSRHRFDWQEDDDVNACILCAQEFTLTYRRHHCRSCGKIVCDECSLNRVDLLHRGHQNARVCDKCVGDDDGDEEGNGKETIYEPGTWEIPKGMEEKIENVVKVIKRECEMEDGQGGWKKMGVAKGIEWFTREPSEKSECTTSAQIARGVLNCPPRCFFDMYNDEELAKKN